MRRRAAAALALVVLTPVAALAATGPVSGSWRLLPPVPIAPDEGLASVWTGSQMLVVSRVTRRARNGAVTRRMMIAAAYDPAAGAWRRLPSPSRTRSFLGYSAVWTGKEMVVWGQGIREAYDPLAGRWRQLPGSKLLTAHDGFGLVAWTGNELIGWGGGCCGDAFRNGVAYRPGTNTWRSLAPSPLAGSQSPIGAWTGRELVVLVGGLDPDGNPWPASLARAAAYDPRTNTWRRIPPLPEPRSGANAVWDGREVLVFGGAAPARAGGHPSPASVGFAYNPVTNRWRRLPPAAGRTGAAAVWAGTRLLVWGGQTSPVGSANAVLPVQGLAYDPGENRWSALPRAPLPGRVRPAAAWTGHILIVWGGQADQCAPGATACKLTLFADGAAFSPASP